MKEFTGWGLRDQGLVGGFRDAGVGLRGLGDGVEASCGWLSMVPFWVP